eukprot:SAG31_NODE_5149_length_2713_cov_6.205903_2_plen_299_part_00
MQSNRVGSGTFIAHAERQHQFTTARSDSTGGLNPAALLTNFADSEMQSGHHATRDHHGAGREILCPGFLELRIVGEAVSDEVGRPTKLLRATVAAVVVQTICIAANAMILHLHDKSKLLTGALYGARIIGLVPAFRSIGECLRDGGLLSQMGAGAVAIPAAEMWFLRCWRAYFAFLVALCIMRGLQCQYRSLKWVFGLHVPELLEFGIVDLDRLPSTVKPFYVTWVILIPMVYYCVIPVLNYSFVFSLLVSAALARKSIVQVHHKLHDADPTDAVVWKGAHKPKACLENSTQHSICAT